MVKLLSPRFGVSVEPYLQMLVQDFIILRLQLLEPQKLVQRITKILTVLSLCSWLEE